MPSFIDRLKTKRAHAYYKSCSALIDKLFLAMNSIQAAIEIFTYFFIYLVYTKSWKNNSKFRGNWNTMWRRLRQAVVIDSLHSWLFSQLEEHDKALRILVHKLKDYGAAENYCMVNSNGKDSVVRKRLFHALLNVYLDPSYEWVLLLCINITLLQFKHEVSFAFLVKISGRLIWYWKCL